MQTITTKQIAEYLNEYESHKGPYRKNAITSWLVGSDDKYIGKLKIFYDGLINIEENRELYPIELFQLSRIVVDAKSAPGSLSASIFDKLRDAYGRNVLAGLAVLQEHHAEYKIYTEDNYNKITAANDPVHVARVIAAMNILHASDLSCERTAALRSQVEVHASPLRLAQGVKGITMPGYKFTTEENLQKVLSSGDPLKTAEEIIMPVVAPGFDHTNPGYFAKLNLAAHMSWPTMFKAIGASSDDTVKKDHDLNECPELQPVAAPVPGI